MKLCGLSGILVFLVQITVNAAPVSTASPLSSSAPLISTSSRSTRPLALPSQTKLLPTSSVITLPPLLIEGIPRPQSDSTPSSKINVVSGFGAKNLDDARNDLGAPLSESIDEDQDLSLQRRFLGWWMKPQGEKKRILSQYQGGMGYPQRSIFHSRLRWGQDPNSIQLGFERDPFNTPLALGYFKWHSRQSSFENQMDLDYLRQSKKNLNEVLGFEEQNQERFTIKVPLYDWIFVPSLRYRYKQFDSTNKQYQSQKSQGVLGSGTLIHRADEFSLTEKIELVGEQMSRKEEGAPTLNWRRLQGQVELSHSFQGSLIEGKTVLMPRFLRDEMSSEDLGTVDAGFELSSRTDRDVGINVQGCRKTRWPTSLERMGDGITLEGSPGLKPALTHRSSLGIWQQGDWGHNELDVFYEVVRNEPVMLSVSPLMARTEGVGRLLARGFQWKVHAQWKTYEFKGNYSFQEAVNQSSIQWQNGQRVPGRPTHALSAQVQTVRRGWKWAFEYNYQSANALDLAGLWFMSPHHGWGGMIGYGEKKWEVRLIGVDLLAGTKQTPHSWLQQTAGIDGIEMNDKVPEVKLLCEIVLE